MRVWKCRIRVITNEASVPSTTDVLAVNNATFRLSNAAWIISRSRNSAPYHLNENPDQTEASLLSLKE